MAKTTPVRAYTEDIPDLTQLRLRLSVKHGRDVTVAGAIRWLLTQPEAQKVLRDEKSKA